jgi:hypothetical protein
MLAVCYSLAAPGIVKQPSDAVSLKAPRHMKDLSPQALKRLEPLSYFHPLTFSLN